MIPGLWATGQKNKSASRAATSDNAGGLYRTDVETPGGVGYLLAEKIRVD